AGKEAQAGGQHFAETGNQAHLRGVCAEALQERTDDAVGAFVRHVREQADHAQADDESNGGGALLLWIDRAGVHQAGVHQANVSTTESSPRNSNRPTAAYLMVFGERRRWIHSRTPAP